MSVVEKLWMFSNETQGRIIVNQEYQKLKKQLQNKMIKAIKDRKLRDVRNLFKVEKSCYKPVRVGKLYSRYFIKYKSNSNRDKTI